MNRATRGLGMFALGVSGLLFGCAISETIEYRPIEYAQHAKLKLNVVLRLHAGLSDQQGRWHDERAGRDCTMFVGPALREHATALALTLFEDVRIDEGGTEDTGSRPILTPKLLAVARTWGSEERTTLLLEWSLTEGQGRPIWVQTVAGTGKGDRNDFQTQGVAALEQLFERSRDAMLASVEIRRFAGSE